MIRRCRIALITVMLAALVPSAALADESDCTVFGTEGDDVWTVVEYLGRVLIDYDAVVCGGDGDDAIWGGAFQGTFYGGKGDDYLQYSKGATFYGGDGFDSVSENMGRGTFYGGDGRDYVYRNYGVFYGGDDDDVVYQNCKFLTHYGEFHGGDGADVVLSDQGGIFVQGD
jgi:Ca2+-binding RTX toxin-like protein